jgi:peptidoglycan hydrolase-like protein with peptidoglycan-binding domain
VSRSRWVIPLCAFAISGCAIFETREMDAETTPAAAPAPVVEPVAPVELSVKETTPIVPRPLTRDDIRRLQFHLKEFGFDPGPADGVAGARTRAAFLRLQNGCAKTTAPLENSAASNAPMPGGNPGSNRIPDREQTLMIQSQLRNAGFDPGPADGVFGSKTKSVLLQIKQRCPTVQDFAGVLNAPAAPAEKQVARGTQAAGVKAQVISSASGIDATKQNAVPQSAQSQEEIRILQLRLRDAGFDPGPFDGIMGPKTRTALQQYEASQRATKTKVRVTSSGPSGSY